MRALSVPGSQIVIEHNLDASQIREESFVREAKGRVNFDLPGLWASESFDPADWLGRRGWTVSTAMVTDVAAGYGRPLDDGMPAMLGATLITAIRS
jgi:O-methyltransferase involved in polyketide biosynthesis